MRCLKIVGKLKLWKRNFKDVFASKLSLSSVAANAHARAPICANVVLNLAPLKKINSSTSLPFFLGRLCSFCSCVGHSLPISFAWMSVSLSGWLFFFFFRRGVSNGLCSLAFFPGSWSPHQVPLPLCLPLPSFASITVSPHWTSSVFQPRIGREAALQSRCVVRSGVTWYRNVTASTEFNKVHPVIT